MCRIIIQDLLSQEASVFLCASLRLCQLLEILQVFSIQFMAFAVMQKNTGVFYAAFEDSFQCLTFIHQFLDVVMYSGCVTALLFITEQKHRIIRIDSRIGNSSHTWIGFLSCKLSVADDHLADLWIITVKPAGKQLLYDPVCCLSSHRLQKEFLIKHCIVLIDLSLFCLAFCKTLHGILIAVVGLRISVLIRDHAGIDISLPCISQRIVVIGKIHKKRLRKLSSIGNIHCFHIIFVQSCDPQTALHSKGKPAEINRFARISLHDIFADGLQHIIGWKFIIACGKCLIQTAIEFLFVA